MFPSQGARRATLGGAGGILVVLTAASTAWACIVWQGTQTVTNVSNPNLASQTTVGDPGPDGELFMEWCDDGPDAERTGYGAAEAFPGDLLHVTVGGHDGCDEDPGHPHPATELDGSENRLPPGLYALTFSDDAAFIDDGHSDGRHTGNDMLAVQNDGRYHADELDHSRECQLQAGNYNPSKVQFQVLTSNEASTTRTFRFELPESAMPTEGKTAQRELKDGLGPESSYVGSMCISSVWPPRLGGQSDRISGQEGFRPEPPWGNQVPLEILEPVEEGS